MEAEEMYKKNLGIYGIAEPGWDPNLESDTDHDVSCSGWTKGASYANAFIYGGTAASWSWKSRSQIQVIYDEDCPERASLMAKWACLDFDGVN